MSESTADKLARVSANYEAAVARYRAEGGRPPVAVLAGFCTSIAALRAKLAAEQGRKAQR